jgi:hypothetical protein
LNAGVLISPEACVLCCLLQLASLVAVLLNAVLAFRVTVCQSSLRGASQEKWGGIG